MFAVVRTNTNHELAVYGPFAAEEDAVEVMHALGIEDHLGVYSVHEMGEVEGYATSEEDDGGEES